MALLTRSRTRAAALLGLLAVILALLAHPGESSATPPTDAELAAAEAAVRDAQEVVNAAKAATRDARARRDQLDERVARRTSKRDHALRRLDDTRQAFTAARERVLAALSRLEGATTPPDRRAARRHLRAKRARAQALRAERVTAKATYLVAQEALDRATGSLAAAQEALTQARSQLRADRIVLTEAEEYYASLLAQMTHQLTTAVANIPNRISDGSFRSSMASLTATHPDFITLNEISSRSVETLRAAGPGYGAYRGGARLSEPGAGSHSVSNAVMWRTDTYEVVARGRIKVVDDDRGYHHKKRFLWDRYATWVTLRSLADGRVTSVISTHMPTNPERFPRQYGDPELTRVQLYALGMDRLVALARRLSVQGPVLLGGDMNSHPNQGYWTAVAKMRAAGYAYTKDSGVMYLFRPLEASVPSSHELRVSSDHPALVTTVQFG